MSIFLISQDTKNYVSIVEVSGHELFLRWSRSANVQWTFEISNGVSLLQSILNTAKNTWVTSTTVLGSLSCISMTKECYQIGFLDFIEELLLQLHQLVSLCSEDLSISWLHFHHKHACNQGTLQGQMCKMIRSKKQQTSPELLIYRVSVIVIQQKKEASHYTLFKL